MNREALEAIESNLPEVFLRRTNVAWPDDLIVIGEDELADRPEGTSLEEALFDEDTGDVELLDRSPARNTEIDSVIDDILRSEPDSTENSASEELTKITDALRERFGDGYPGAPGSDDGGAIGSGGAHDSAPPTLSPDFLAFYLPWHYFSSSLWGIYFIVEGLQALAAQVRQNSLGYLSQAESARVAKSFLFHHEAYHNAVEMFAARLEVSHRVPCYISGFQTIRRAGFNAGRLHEEGLATAYAADKVRSSAFEDVYPAGPMRTNKRKIAYAVMQNIIRHLPTVYRSALSLPSVNKFREAQALFLEENHNSCFPLILRQRTTSPKVWEASPHSMRPSLQRNKSFSYVVRRSNPAVRRALHVPHFKRTEFLAKLHARIGGTEIHQGRGEHPKWRSAQGKVVPIPGHRELGRGLCRAILRQLGVNMSLTEFMSNSGPLPASQQSGP